jgi:uncharacterized integral membrane protein (TIGR00698 family)
MAKKTVARPSPETADATPHLASPLPGLVVTGLGVALALLAHRLFSQVGVLTWAVVLGAAAANLNLLPGTTRPGLRLATRRLLRVGVALLGFSLPVAAILALGLPMIGLVVVTLITTLLATTWLGTRMGLGRPRSLLIGTGFAICGASAIAAMEENAEADEDDVAMAIAMVTLCGTVAMIVLPLLQRPLGLSDAQLGAWAGAGVHEVGQVVAAASPAGAAAVSVAIVVKLTRVLLLAPLVAGVSAQRRRRGRAAGIDAGTDGGTTRMPPLVPPFVLAFLACVTLRSVGVVTESALGPLAQIQTIALGAALFGMGTAVHLRSLVRGSGPVLLLSTVSTLVVGGISLGGVLWLV